MTEAQAAGDLCVRCGAAVDPDADVCPSCGAGRYRTCPACGARNALDAPRCAACGQQLEILDAMLERLTTPRARWLHDVQRGAPAVKAEADRASQERLAQLWAEEMERRQELQRALLERERQQRLLTIVAVAAVALALIALLVTLALVLR